MIDRKKLYYLTPALLGVIIFVSNFLSTELFTVDFKNFAAWFVLSAFAFSCGWLINKTLEWTHGGKIVFSVIVSTVIITIFFVSFFNNYFGVNDPLTENMILYSLRNIMLGAMAFFGMALAEMMYLQRELQSGMMREQDHKKILDDAQKEAALIVNEAKVKAEKLLLDIQKKSNELDERKNKIETKLKEFVQAEKELIKKYEEND